MNHALQVFGSVVVTSATATAVVIAILRLLGTKWVDKYFAQQLKLFERRQQEILNIQQYQINSLFSRVSKIHEKEYEVLPKIWMLLQDARNEVKGLADPWQQFPGLDRYSLDELTEFLENSGLTTLQKKKIKEQDNKTDYYRRAMYWNRMQTIHDAISEFRKYLQYNRIFLGQDLFSLFSGIEKAIIEIQVDLENPCDPENPYPKAASTFKEIVNKIDQLCEQIELAVQRRMHLSDA